MTRTFKAIRNTDFTGVSGEGHIADGVVFEDGTTVLRWRTKFRSTAVYESFEHMQTIHGHNGATQFIFDEPVSIDDLIKQVNNGLLSIDEARVELRRKPWGFPGTADPLINGWRQFAARDCAAEETPKDCLETEIEKEEDAKDDRLALVDLALNLMESLSEVLGLGKADK